MCCVNIGDINKRGEECEFNLPNLKQTTVPFPFFRHVAFKKNENRALFINFKITNMNRLCANSHNLTCRLRRTNLQQN